MSPQITGDSVQSPGCQSAGALYMSGASDGTRAHYVPRVVGRAQMVRALSICKQQGTLSQGHSSPAMEAKPFKSIDLPNQTLK